MYMHIAQKLFMWLLIAQIASLHTLQGAQCAFMLRQRLLTHALCTKDTMYGLFMLMDCVCAHKATTHDLAHTAAPSNMCCTETLPLCQWTSAMHSIVSSCSVYISVTKIVTCHVADSWINRQLPLQLLGLLHSWLFCTHVALLPSSC